MKNNDTMITNTTNLPEKIRFPREEDFRFFYACCGNCRFFDDVDWCGRHRCRTTGGDHCSYWEE